MKNAKPWAFALLALVAAYGCASSGSGDDSGQSENDLSFGSGTVDHAAIVEISTMMLAGGPLDGHLDPYNREDPFAIRRAAYDAAFAQRLDAFDQHDGHTDWTPEQKATWLTRIATGNYQIIDTSKPCDWANPHTYLEIERAQLTGRPHTTCGGRMPNEDAMDVTLNLLIRGPAASAQDPEAIGDGVDAPTQWSTDTFPYLADLNGF